jgi:hypothetical protein
MKYFKAILCAALMTATASTAIFAQNVGVATDTPDAPFHVRSSGQVLTSGGLMLLGDRAEGHLELDFNRIQSLYDFGSTQLDLLIQPDGGDIGIGVSAPVSRIHVAGFGDQILTLHKMSSGSGKVGLDLLRGSEFSATDWRIVNDGGKLRFYDNSDNFQTAGDLDMTITNAGRVGIGIDAPNAALHVIGSELVSGTGEGYFQVGSPTGSHLRFDGNEMLARNGDNSSLLFLQYWGGDLSLCYDNNGQVGIGTLFPVTKLQIIGGGDASLASGGELVLGATTGANMALDGNEILARNNGAVAPLYLQVSGGDLMLIPNETGQVAIGVASLGNLPDPTYLFVVDGKILVEEVRVELSGNWPDYVFHDSYDLLPLDVLENEIETLGHLPGMPAALNVEEEGFELGDMQRIMLEKIEELTLYVIDLNKNINALKAKNKQLESRLNKQNN